MMLAPLLYIAAQSAASIEADPRLAASVTIEVPIITLQALAAQLTKETGVPLKVADGIRDRKATLFVKDRSARETMAALADTFFIDWLPDGKGYRAVLAKGVADDEAEAVRTDRERMKAKIDDMFAGWRDLDPISPTDQAQQQWKLSKELQTLAGRSDQASEARKEAIHRWLELSGEGTWSSFAIAYAGHQKEVDEALLAGGTLFASSRPEDDCPKLGESYKKNLSSGRNRGWSDEAIAVMHVDFGAATLRGMFAFVGERPGLGAPIGPHLLTEDDSAYRISKRFAAWSAVAELAVAETPLGAVPPGNPRLITLGDQLVCLHSRTDVPIVADAYRVPCTVGRQTGDSVGDFAERLTKFSDMRFNKAAVRFRLSHGWVEARHARYWRLEPREIAEEVLRPMEELSARGHRPNTEQYATLAAGLTDVQAAGLADHQCPTIVAFATNPLVAVRSLRVWASLTDEQRSIARGGDGLRLDSLGTQPVALAKAALLNTFWGGTMAGRMLSLALGDATAVANAKLFFQEEPITANPDFNEFEVMNDRSLFTRHVPATGVIFSYGPDKRNRLFEMFTAETR